MCSYWDPDRGLLDKWQDLTGLMNALEDWNTEED